MPHYAGLSDRVTAICQEARATGLAQVNYQGRKLTIYLPNGVNRDYPNPINYIQQQAAVSPVLFGTIYDNLNTDSILFWEEGNVRFLPPPSSQEGPLIHDLAAFEFSLHLRLFRDLTKRIEIEAYLLSGENTNESFSGPSELRQTAMVINLTRQLAATYESSYYSALFFVTMSYISGYDPAVRHIPEELIDYVHTLFIAAMLCQRQNRFNPLPVEAPNEARETLWIDTEAKKVWIEGAHIPVTSQEFDILSYLYARAGRPCSREAILKEALGDDVNDLFVEQSRLDSAMSRLRLKIETNPKQPRYLHTLRGHGYQLNLTR